MSREIIWKQEQSILQQQASNISRLKKQISKEAEIDATIQISIHDKIEFLKQMGTSLAKRLENQKQKNVLLLLIKSELEIIIQHIRSTMEKQRELEATHRDDINFDSITSLDAKFKKFEYDLSQINSRTNKICQNVTEKRIKINQLRTERVIDSGIFRNIEKQLIQSELKFKKLLIEKIKYEKDYQKMLSQYKIMKQKAQCYYISKDSSKHPKNNIESNHLSDNVSLSGAKNKHKFIELQLSNQKITTNKIFTNNHFEDQQENEKTKKEFCVKKVMIETGVQNPNQLLQLITEVDLINESFFEQMNKLTDESNQIEKQIQDIKVEKESQRMHFYTVKKQISKNEQKALQTKQIKQKMISTTKLIEQELAEFDAFFNNQTFILFLKQFGLKSMKFEKNEGISNFDQITQILQQIEVSMQQIIKNYLPEKQEKNITSRVAKEEKLDELIHRVKKLDECDKVMKKEDFQEQYKRMLKNNSQKILANKSIAKRKSWGVLKK